MVPLRSNTIQLVQNRCSFDGLWSEDPNQHLKDFLKLVDLLKLDVANRERRTAKLRNDILMFQQHQGPQNGSFSTYSSNMPSGSSCYQTKLKRTLNDFDFHQEKRLSSLGNQLKEQQDEVINKMNTLWKEMRRLQTRELKVCQKLLSPKSSIREQNRNSSSSKRVYFVNIISIIRKEDEAKEEDIKEPNAVKDNNHNVIDEIEEKLGGELSGPETLIGEGELRDIKRDDPDDRARGDTKEVDEADEESEESKDKVEEEKEEE
nr:zinc finger, CCHC-type [Tanacetum cinerariifolium]